MRRIPPIAIALWYVDRINRGDLDGLVALLSENHRLEVFDEPPVAGRDANASAWQGYLTAFPQYVIHPRRVHAAGNIVAILGHTTGSHLNLPDAEEEELTLIWLADVSDNAVDRWRLIEDSPSNRRQFGLGS